MTSEANRHYLDRLPVVCDLTAITSTDREVHVRHSVDIFRATLEVRDLPDGYALRLPNEDGMFLALAQFIENERRCCPFYHFSLEVEPNHGPLWLRLTGSDDAKALLKGILGADQDPDTLARIHAGGDIHLSTVVAQALPRLAGLI